jgi:hypothetical protein
MLNQNLFEPVKNNLLYVVNIWLRVPAWPRAVGFYVIKIHSAHFLRRGGKVVGPMLLISSI